MKNTAETIGRQTDRQSLASSSSARRLLTDREAELKLSEQNFLASARRDNESTEARPSPETLAAHSQMAGLIESLEELAEVKCLQLEENLWQRLDALDRRTVASVLESGADINLPMMLGFLMATAQCLEHFEKPGYFVQRRLEGTATAFLEIFENQGYMIAEGCSTRTDGCQFSESDFQELLRQLAQEYRTHFPHAHGATGPAGTSSIST